MFWELPNGDIVDGWGLCTWVLSEGGAIRVLSLDPVLTGLFPNREDVPIPVIDDPKGLLGCAVAPDVIPDGVTPSGVEPDEARPEGKPGCMPTTPEVGAVLNMPVAGP